MSSVQRNTKIYGAVETESFITFQGFCKKIYDTEQQKIEIFIDDKKVDTLLANQNISDIEDTYEVFDTNGFCFTYKLPKEYLGEKHKIEFKTLDNQHLLHSPIWTKEKTDKKYLESLFLESINELIDEEKIKDLYCSNCIGIIATQENLNDKYFIDYIKNLCNTHSIIKIKFITFDENEIIKINQLFNNYEEQVTILSPKTIYELANEIEIFLYTNDNYVNLYYKFLKYSNEIVCLDIRFKRKHISDYDEESKNHEIFINPLKYNIDDKEINDYSNSYTKIIYERAYHKTINNDYNINIEDNGTAFYFFERVNLILKSKDFKHFIIQNFFKILKS